MLESTNQSINLRLRKAFLAGKKVAELITIVLEEYNTHPDEKGNYEFQRVFVHFKEAFLLTVKQSLDVGLWHGFEAGSYDDDEIDNLIQPQIRNKMALWADA